MLHLIFFNDSLLNGEAQEDVDEHEHIGLIGGHLEFLL